MFKHHLLVRITHWLNAPLLLGMVMSGISIYWASPVYKHLPNAAGGVDYLADVGVWIVRHVPGLHGYATPDTWVYDHLGLGAGALAVALQLHWFFGYLFLLNGLIYLIGLGVGGGFRALLPRRKDASEAFAMVRFYVGWVPHRLLRKPWTHPVILTKYNALQSSAYFAIPVAGGLSVLTGWAMHKPQQLSWLAWFFGGYDGARVWHFWLMWAFVLFVGPHVLLVFLYGWDTFRSMVTGWSEREVEHDVTR